MAEVIKLPAVAADSAGGALSRWLKQEGEGVRAGDVLAEIETDKAVVEIAAEQGGVLARIIVAAGPAQLNVNTVLGVIRAEGEQDEDVERALEEAGIGREGAKAASAGPSHGATAAAATVSEGESVASSAQNASASSSGGEDSGQRIHASPLARRLALERGIRLASLAGSGPRGRIVKRDVDAAGTMAATGDAAHTARAATASAGAAPITAASGAVSHAGAVPEGASVSGAPATRIPHTNMRRTIARRLGESKQSVPHFYLTVDCRMDALLDLREAVNRQAARKISVNDFIVKAAARALVEVPDVNVSWEPDALLHHASADISVAVATEGGLTTPIVRDAERKSLGQVADEIASLAARAREHRLRPEDYTGGSMTISNLGMHGVREFAAIINPPQAAILAVGAAERRAVVGEQGAVIAARVMTVTLSADHRAIDGAVGARWLAAFRGLIENPLRILL
ncbi:2-oxo acid dehydrogenases acyltransferase [Bordetella ansorpii]|uniref:Acetyltransferase component of pyruvate dehydrogenase complex n=1 Tax=Bordetella ansorpii TaxID=288768 RepID=A0A157LDU8_9BORD|nr:pyruvate dehydrogenase complex dihydrolipoamide acetyltransferase [Bordetella ansorpii]SAH94606.1 2-oxo acid dehydrogenases acyltransferase [Bordetella ansorpii]